MCTYRCLQKQVYSKGDFKLVPIRHEDRYKIMEWRNEQMYHLRQSEPLTAEMQDAYFEDVVTDLFDQEHPNQILFSFLKEEECLGYGGLVHINWKDRNAELSFIMDTRYEKKSFSKLWTVYLKLVDKVAFQDVGLHKIFTYAFDLRPKLYQVLEGSGYQCEAKLTEHVFYDGMYTDVVIHSKWNSELNLRLANEGDIKPTFKWVNNKVVREFSFKRETVDISSHKKWFMDKLMSDECLYLIAEIDKKPAGSFRIDTEDGESVVSFLLDPEYHGKGLGKTLLSKGIEWAKEKWPNTEVVGYMLPENIASQVLFTSLGFAKSVTSGKILKFTLK